MTIITRVGFCEACFKAQRPRTDNFFVAMGKNGWHIMQAKHIGNIGFTPHLYKLIKSIGQNIIYEKMCSMHDCGTEVYWSQQHQNYRFDLGSWEKGMMLLSDWNSLQKYKHDEDYQI